MRFVVVSGPPCSGKSTYVRDNMGDRDVIFDYDRVSAALTYADEHTVNGRAYAHPYVMDMRSSFVATAKNGTGEAETLWFIMTNLTDKVKAWLEPLNPEYIEMQVSEKECLRRLKKDDTRPDKDAWKSVIKKWFADHQQEETEMKSKPMQVVMQASGICKTFWIYDDILPDSHDDYGNLVESRTSARYFADNLNGMTAADIVVLYINSMGGSVKEALGIYSVLQRCPAPVTAYIDGFACSAASVIAMAADKVIMPRNTAMMIHNASGGAWGTANDLRKAADDLDVINRAAIQSYTMHAGDKLPEDELQKMLDAETWLTAEDCVKWGLADELGTNEVDPAAAMQQFTAAAQAASNGPDARLYANPPAFLSARPPEPRQESKPNIESCVARLLKNMI